MKGRGGGVSGVGGGVDKLNIRKGRRRSLWGKCVENSLPNSPSI